MGDLVERLVTAMNRHDLEGAASLFAEDYRSEQPAHPGRAFVGRAQMQANWQAMFAGIPDFQAELVRAVDDGDTTWTEWVWSGSRRDGKPFDVRGVALFQIEDDKIRSARLYLEDVDQTGGGIEDDVQAMSGERPRTADADPAS